MTRVAVVTGALGGIGAACLRQFAAEGWTVAGIDRHGRPDDPAFEAFAELDLAADDSGPALTAFLEGLGRVDALVNNAGLLVGKPLVETTDEEWSAVMRTNVGGAFIAIRAAFPFLRETRGAIVNVSSVHAIATNPGLAAYATSKGALVSMTRAVALELAPLGIRVNAILPGAVDTPMLRDRLALDADGSPDAALAELAAGIPIGRIAGPDEIARLIVLLADSERSSFLTGQVWVADGGVTARLATK